MRKAHVYIFTHTHRHTHVYFSYASINTYIYTHTNISYDKLLQTSIGGRPNEIKMKFNMRSRRKRNIWWVWWVVF